MAENNNPNKLNGKVIFYTCLVVLFGAAFVFCVGTMIRDFMVQREAEKQGRLALFLIFSYIIGEV